MNSSTKQALTAFVAIVLIGAAALLTTVLPKQAVIQRSVVIIAPPQLVYEQVVDLEAYQAWSPFAAADRTMEVTYGAKKSGVGASYSWTGDKSGAGSLTVVEATRPTRIVNTLEFGEMGGGRAVWTFEPDGRDTRATWTVTTTSDGMFAGVFALLADSMIGPTFEDGLDRLKTVAESKK